MSARRKIIVIVVMLVIISIAAIALYMMYKKKKGSSTYNAMIALGNQYLPDGFPQWLLDNARNKESNVTEYYLIHGKATDASYLLAAYDQGYAGYGYEYKNGKATKGTPYKGEELALHSALHRVLQQAKK